jgi:hypothetical protein
MDGGSNEYRSMVYTFIICFNNYWVYSLLFTKKSLSLLSIGGHKEEGTYREDPIPMSSGPWEHLFQDPHS